MTKNKISVYSSKAGATIDIKVVPNQKVIEVCKINSKKGKILDVPTNRQAQKELSAQAYVLYMHFILHVPGYKEALSLEHILNTTSLSERGYYKSIKELIDKRYLIKNKHKDYSDFYHFYESPQPEDKEWEAETV